MHPLSKDAARDIISLSTQTMEYFEIFPQWHHATAWISHPELVPPD
jgi:hypothetical protein